jgi:hypothetical protein
MDKYGGKQVGPGIYAKDDGEVHFDIPELLEACGWEDTEENRDAMIVIAEESVRELGMKDDVEVEIKHLHDHTCPRCQKEYEHEGLKEKCIRPVYSICPVCSS